MREVGVMADALSIDIVVERPLWAAQPTAEPVLRRVLNEGAESLLVGPAEVAVILTDDASIRRLNRDWRGIDRATNVLSFPLQAPASGSWRPERPAGPVHLGDIVIAYETTQNEAMAEAKRFDHHLAHLALHGFLHLLGHDHDDHSKAEAMENLERAILARLGVADPYAAPDAACTAADHA